MAEATKDTIYVDVDDEITAIIDKLQASDGKVVALVLPKRATVLQSIVNMKLLKRTVDETKKNVVLITSEAGLLPLAGAVGMYVAKTLTSRPEIPATPLTGATAEESIDEVDGPEETAEPVTATTAGDRPVGELAGTAAVAPKPPLDDSIETLELDDDELGDAAAATAASDLATIKKPKVKKDKKLAVPNFDRFRLWLVLGALLIIILVVFGYFALDVLPKASIAIKTDASNVNTSVNLTADTTATSLNASKDTIPAKLVQEQKTYTGSATTTGQKNEGNKASGSVTMSAGACSVNVPDDVPAGSGISANGVTYITQSDTSFVPTASHGKCTYQASQTTNITAQTGGTNANTNSVTSFTVAGRSDITATGSASGGTDNNVQVVAQADIDSAKDKVTSQDSVAKQDLETQLQNQNLYALETTFSDGTPAFTNSANVGDATSTVTVTETVTYTMFGAAQSGLKTLVDNDIKSQINTGEQGILSEGISQNSFKLSSQTATAAQLTLQTTAEVGPNIDVNNIKQQAVGKKAGDIESTIKSDPDVTDVTVHFSPFWVTSAPKKLTKITVTVAKPTATLSSNDGND
jgi:hypothetical protein